MVTALVTIGSLGRAASAGQGSLTLAEVFQQHGVAGDWLGRTVLGRPVSGHVVERDDEGVVVAYVLGDGSLHVARVERAAATAQDVVVRVEDGVGAGQSVSELRRRRPFIYVTTHLTPSAGRVIVLNDADLTVRRVLDGWAVAALPDGSTVLHENQVHFAPTHTVEFSVFDPRTLAMTRIYPPPAVQPVRRAFIERVTEVYRARGTAWFAEHNHHMDPARFDTALVGAVTVDAAAGTLSFEARFGDPENRQDPLPFSQRVSVTCAPIDDPPQLQCREHARDIEGQR